MAVRAILAESVRSQTLLDYYSEHVTLFITWFPAHERVADNERANSLAVGLSDVDLAVRSEL